MLMLINNSHWNKSSNTFHPLEWQPLWGNVKVKRERVAQSCPTLCNPMDCSLPNSTVHGVPQARMLEWVAIPFSRGSSWPTDSGNTDELSSILQMCMQCLPLKMVFPPCTLAVVQTIVHCVKYRKNNSTHFCHIEFTDSSYLVPLHIWTTLNSFNLTIQYHLITHEEIGAQKVQVIYPRR